MKILLVVYDNGSYIHWFPQGLAYIAAILKDHDVTIYSKDQYHYPEAHLTEYLNKNRFDVVGLGVIAGYWQYQEMLRISVAVNASKNRPFFVIGGHGPSPEPDFFLRKTGADAVVIGEGERTITDLIYVLENYFTLATVKGIAYREGGQTIINENRELIKDIDSLPLPAWNLFPMDYYALLREPNIRNNERCFPVITARGCPFKCNFCYRMDKGIRLRSVESVIDEIWALKWDYRISYIAFTDELFMSSESRVTELCEAFMDLNIRWSCQGRLNYATPEIIRMMKRAGCAFINYGIECLDDDILKVMNKNLTVEQITKGIEATLAEGVSPGFNIIFGNIGENEETLQAGVDFLLKYDDHSQLRTVRPVTPYPGSPLYYHAIEKGLLKDAEDFYENKHKNSDLLAVNFTTLSDEDFNRCMFGANKTLIENYHRYQSESQIESYKRLYFENDVSFRGLRQT